jgi:hypothetical protein
MLRSDADAALKVQIAAKSQDYRGKLDGFRTRTKYDRDFHMLAS